MSPPWPLQVTALRPLSCGSVLWRMGGAYYATIIVKATFGLVHGGPARLIAPVDLVRSDKHRDRSPVSSLEEASEIAPYLPRGGVTLVGHAHAAGGRPVPAMSVRLAIYRDRPLLEKTLHVFGDRTPQSASSPTPFQRVPIVYERAFGGAGVEENPVGVGADPAARALPNIVDPADARRPAGFGPISRYWGSRKRMLGGAERRSIEAPMPEIPDGFDWRYFQAAPADQQLEPLAGDEWIVLDGLNASLPRLQARLPGARALARWFAVTPQGPGPLSPIELAADTLAIDADRQLGFVIWRGNFPVESPDAARRLRVLAGVELPGHPLTWPDPKDVPALPAEDDEPASRSGADASEDSGARPAGGSQGRPAVVDELGMTRGIDARAVAARAVTPFVSRPPAPLSPSSSPPADPSRVPDDEASTRMINVDEIAARGRAPAVPFASAPGAPRAGAPQGSIPGAPFGAPKVDAPQGGLPPAWQKPRSTLGSTADGNTTGAFRANDVKAALPFAPPDPSRPPAIISMAPSAAERAHKMMTGTTEFKLPVVPGAALPFGASGQRGAPEGAARGDVSSGAQPGASRAPAEVALPAMVPADSGPATLPQPPAMAPSVDPLAVFATTSASSAAAPPAMVPPATAPSAMVPPAAAPPAMVPPAMVSSAPAPPAMAPPAMVSSAAAPPAMAPPAMVSSAAAPPAMAPPAMVSSTPASPSSHAEPANVPAFLSPVAREPSASAEPELVEPARAAPVEPSASAEAALSSASSAPEDGLRMMVTSRLRAREAVADLALAGADLSGLDFTGARLSGADLKGTNLSKANLTNAHLGEAQLVGADLTDARLEGADLSRADLTRATLSGARLDGAILSETNLSSARGVGASFARVTGRRAVFARGAWERASFAGMDMMGAEFTGASLTDADLSGAALIDVRLDDVTGERVKLDGAKLPQAHAQGAALTSSSFKDVDAPGSNWEKATLSESSFAGANLKGASLLRATCVKSGFVGADLTSANLQRLSGDGADLSSAKMEGVDLRQARLQEASFDGASMQRVNANKADLTRSRFARADLTGANLRASKMKGAILARAQLDAADLRDADLEQANMFGAARQTAKMSGANTKDLVETDPDADR